MKIDLQQTAAALKGADDILILSHRRPDGDTTGCAFALYYALQQLGKKVRLECADEYPAKYQYFYGRYLPQNFAPRFIVTVDTATEELLGSLQPLYAGEVDLAIDHHKSNTFYAKQTLLDTSAPATAEILYLLLEELGVTFALPKSDEPGIDDTTAMCNALFTGLVTDTGRFLYASVTARTHRVAAQLMEHGAQAGMINQILFENLSKGRLDLEAWAICSMEYMLDNHYALLYLPLGIAEKYGVDSEEMDGISSLPRKVEGIQVGVTIRQQEDQSFRISVRTMPPVDASHICTPFGGGGHAGAAGCTISGDLGTVKQQLLNAVRKELGDVARL